MSHQPPAIRPPAAANRRITLIGAVVLLGVLAAAVLVALAVGDRTPSFHSAVAFTATVCGAAALTGWLISRRPCRNSATAVAAGLAAVLVRLAVPLAALARLQTGGGEALRVAGAGPLLAGLYLSLLATDIVLNIIFRKKHLGSRDAMRSN